MSELRDLIKNFLITIPFVSMLFVAYGLVDQNELNTSVELHAHKARQEQRTKIERDINTLIAKAENQREAK